MSKQKEDQPEINEEEEVVEAADPPAKKGRGRPKSTTKKAAPAKDPNAPKRGRGRPPAVKDESDEEEVAETEAADEPVVKKGRGRPRTKPQTDKPAKDPNAPKRGRGRPPKQAKGRGRPPKAKVAAPVEDNEEADEATE